MQDLYAVAQQLVAAGKGILAADESIATMSTRLEAVGVTASAVNRRDYRHLLISTPGLADWVSGVILSDETFGQDLPDGTPFPVACAAAGLMPGVKVDTGTTPLPFSDGGLVTEGLDGLRGRLDSYHARGALFAKWRAVLNPTGLSRRTVSANAHALARYAALCQEVDIVPIVEPEVLMDGSHSIAMCQAVTANVINAVFDELDRMSVDPRGIVLKPNMVVAGTRHETQASPAEVAQRTVAVLRSTVPATVRGIAFLSGGQTNEQACTNLAAINDAAGSDPGYPTRLTFSFGRALVDDALRAWRGQRESVRAAQQALAGNCARAGAAASRSRIDAERVSA